MANDGVGSPSEQAALTRRRSPTTLLVPRPWDDKSRYWRQDGFELENRPDLVLAIRRLVDGIDAVADRVDPHGAFYRVEAALTGSAGKPPVVCIWLKQAVEGRFKFVTLRPARSRSGHVSDAV